MPLAHSESELTASRVRRAAKPFSLLIASILGGCAVPMPGTITVTEAERAERIVYTCPNKRPLEVTRAQAGQVAFVVFDGRTLQLPRGSHPAAELYSNGHQTLIIVDADSATFESSGQATRCGTRRVRDRD